MAYPSAPWNLNGLARISLHLVDVEQVRPWIPPELSIVSVFPGKTLGSVYISAYTQGSDLEYNELIVAPALLTYAGKVGSWVSHIYVNNEDSVAGGRETWGLPKEMAEFAWSNSAVRVWQGDRELCSFSVQPTWLQLPSGLAPNLAGLVFTRLNSKLTWFEAQFQGNPAVVNAHLSIPRSSPFQKLGLSQPFLALSTDELRLRVNAPV